MSRCLVRIPGRRPNIGLQEFRAEPGYTDFHRGGGVEFSPPPSPLPYKLITTLLNFCSFFFFSNVVANQRGCQRGKDKCSTSSPGPPALQCPLPKRRRHSPFFSVPLYPPLNRVYSTFSSGQGAADELI